MTVRVPHARSTSADVNVVKGASQLTTTAFDPNPKALSLGAGAQVSVRWVNADGGGGYGGGAAVTHQIASDHCAIHPNMVGTITVAQ